MGSVRQRGGLFAQLSLGALTSINGLKTYSNPQLLNELLAFDSAGTLYKENPQGTINTIVTRAIAAGTLQQSVTLFGREYITRRNASGLGFDIPLQYDDSHLDRVSHSGPGIAPTAVDSVTAGNIVAGLHQVTVAFINRQGFITQYAPPLSWTAGGNKQVALSNIATGPPNIVARLILFTPVITAPATTGSFFSMPTGTTQLATPTVMLIADNTTTTLTVDFTDTILIASFQGNYLATQRTLGEASFAGGYNYRTAWLAERNRQQNFVNMDFDGGFQGTPIVHNVGPNSPTVASQGSGSAAWSNVNNILVLDGVVASAVIPFIPHGLNFSVSNPLKAQGFGFAIPATATIAGIIFTAYVSATGGTISDEGAFILRGGVATGGNNANGSTWGSTIGPLTYGNSTYLWGLTWVPADINDPTFGFDLIAQNNSKNFTNTANVDYISATIYYTLPGGGTIPFGWTAGLSAAGAGSALALGFTADWGDAFAITGDGVTVVRGQITQSAYLDYLLVPIIARATTYRVRARVAFAGTLNQGVLHINLQSTIGGFTTTGLMVNSNQLATTFQEFDAVLTNALVTVPTDLLIQVYADGTPSGGGTFLVDSIEVYPVGVPYNFSTAFLSHAFNPESFDNTTSQIQVRPNDGQKLNAAFPIRNNYYLAKDHYLCYVTDDGVNEPSSWPVNEVSETIGICGPDAVDTTEEWAVWAERSGAYICWGSDPVKISQEIEEDATSSGKIAWSSINWDAAETIWVRIDRTNRRILFGAPINGATTPNVVFVLDYKWLESAEDIAASPVVTYSAFTGKILAHGKGRRWTYWNISANAACFAERTDGTAQPFFGNALANGKIYQQIDAPAQLSDDGAFINAQYQTSFNPDAMTEQMLQLGSNRKLLGYLKFRVIGLGTVFISIITSNRTTTLRNYALSTTPAGDGERPVNMNAERFSILFLSSTVNTWWQLEKCIPMFSKTAAIAVRGVSS